MHEVYKLVDSYCRLTSSESLQLADFSFNTLLINCSEVSTVLNKLTLRSKTGRLVTLVLKILSHIVQKIKSPLMR